MIPRLVPLLGSRDPHTGFQRAAALLGWTLLALAYAPAPAGAQSTERVLFVSVVDQAGRPVADVSSQAFTVRENGVAREVLRVGPATEPLQIAVLVDNSAAASPYISNIRDGLTAFVTAAHERAEIAIVSIADRPTIQCDYTRDLAALTKGATRIFSQSGSGAVLLDAISEVAQGMKKREMPRPVILLITTEGADFSNVHYDPVFDRLRDSGASLHALVVGSPADVDMSTDEARNREMVLARGTAGTGGRRDQVLAASALPGKLKDVAADLTHQYRVVYSRPASLIPPDKIEVAVKNPLWTARGIPARQGGS